MLLNGQKSTKLPWMSKNLTSYFSILLETEQKNSICLGTEKLVPIESTKYLGIYIDENLSWHEQIEMTNNKIKKDKDILWTMRCFQQEKQPKDLHSSSIKPCGILSW